MFLTPIFPHMLIPQSTIENHYGYLDRALTTRDASAIDDVFDPGFMSWAGDRPRSRSVYVGGLASLVESAGTIQVSTKILRRRGLTYLVSRRVRLWERDTTSPSMTVVQVRQETWRPVGRGYLMVRQDELPLERQLRRMMEADQKTRMGKIDLEAMRRIDAQNLPRLRAIVRQYGWPSTTQVGTEPAHNLWLLVQHMDAAPYFQKNCLRRMAPLVPKGEASPTDFAYLTDRVRVNTGQRQLYGTQWKRTDDGKWIPQPVADPDTLAERRRKLGLPTMDEYRKQLERVYGPATAPNSGR